MPVGAGDVASEEFLELLSADGEELEELCRAADALRRERVGDDITYAVNRNLDPALGAQDPELLGALLDEAVELGATEVCLQGPLPAELPGGAYLDLIDQIHSRQPSLHIHAFRPAEVADAAARTGVSAAEFLGRARAAGLGSVPGTGARILDDGIRAALTGGTDIPSARWIELIETAHAAGLRSTATMVYGHLETPAQQLAHLRRLAEIQARTGGFTELILMPIQPEQVPPAVHDRLRLPDRRETRALHAVARLMLAGDIDHIQAAWPKYGLDGARAVLTGGADDMGGILLDGTLAPEAGPEAHNSVSVADLEAVADRLGRGLRQRTTLYGEVA